MNSQIAQYRYGIFLILLMISFPLTQQLGKTNKAKELSPRPNEPAQAAKQLEPSSDLQVSSFIELNSQSQIPSRHPANRQGSECQTNRQCQYLNSCIKGKCVHKSLYDPRLAEILGLFLILIGSGISNAGGIGGGGLLIPILILQLRFETHEAIPISKLMIFTGALTAFLMGLRNNKHPYRDGGAIDYNLASMLIPMILFGTMVGVTLNKLTPPWIILVSLTLCLVINTVKTIQK